VIRKQRRQKRKKEDKKKDFGMSCISRSRKLPPIITQVSRIVYTYAVPPADLRALTSVHALHTPEISRFYSIR